MTIDMLCKVVDNYGDIGVVYRLAKSLSERESAIKLRLIVDDLKSFGMICPGIDPSLPVQCHGGWTVVRWDSPWDGFFEEPPRIVLECFACGRPQWYEDILFDTGNPARRVILNIEHLTAEIWADELHRMPSATRSADVKKWIFMPGFTSRTGGLVIDRRFSEDLVSWRITAGKNARRAELFVRSGIRLQAGDNARFWVLVFSYERSYDSIISDLVAYAHDRPLAVLVASGRSAVPVIDAWERAGKPFPLYELPFLSQETWDEFLLASDFAIVRGEESLARAASGGIPFLWHAYLQDGQHQLEKVRALLERMRPLFSPAAFAAYERLSLDFNTRVCDNPDQGGGEPLLPVLRLQGELQSGFAAFSGELLAQGELAANLVTFFSEIG